MDPKQIDAFQYTVWAYYRAHGRHDLPWRLPLPDGSFDVYRIVVSEIMLQQTQVVRVIPKFKAFTRHFPTFAELAAAPLAEVLKSWSGLGYNRRAKFLWQAAQTVTQQFDGQLPQTLAELVRLPGIGPNTAGAILAYAYNRPAVFIETNIRTAFIYHFFTEVQGVHDKDIADLVAVTLPDNPREWYWALMDYGSYIKQTIGNISRASAHHTVQSKFEGSRRQIRGLVLRELGAKDRTFQMLEAIIRDERLRGVLEDMIHEGFIEKTGVHYKLYGT
ncbi:MAG TPA: hypothetical protein VJ836_02270 [Candidatus Saccharimonadales bacterium]|nr:hypothetical protein [Candidatus Saccharimonadales bacterium]